MSKLLKVTSLLFLCNILLSNEVDFLLADKHESLLRIDSMILMWMVKLFQSSQNSKFAMSLQYIKKEVKDQVDILHADKHQSFLKVYFNTLGIKVSFQVDIIIINGHIKHFKITQSNRFAIPLQYPKKEVRNGGHFWHADKIQSFYKLVLSFLMEVAIHAQNTQNRKLVIFLQYIKKKLLQLLRVLL